MNVRRGQGAGTIAALILALVFGMTLLLSLITGAGVYRNVEERVERASAERVGLTYISAKIHAADEAGAVEAGSFEGLDAVFLYEDMGGLEYETILYVYEGKLMELFCERGWELMPENGEEIADAESLEVEAEGKLLRLKYRGADGREERADIYLRSGGEA